MSLSNTTTNNVALLLLRAGLGALMLVHGIPKLTMLLSGDAISFPSVMGMSATLSLILTVVAEVICAVLLIIGLFTRVAAVPLIITMLVAAFVIHGADPFAKQELALLYLLGFTVLAIAGSGKYSIDYLLVRNDLKAYHPEIKPEDPTITIYQ